MSTRKLILAALLCGLAIMVAGGIKLFQTLSDTEDVPPLTLGRSATLGDMRVSVESIDSSETAVSVTVTMVGVDGADPEQGWGAFVTGDSAIRMPIAAPGDAGTEMPAPCDGQVTSATSMIRCRIYFDATPDTPVVIYKRATLTQRWSN